MEWRLRGHARARASTRSCSFRRPTASGVVAPALDAAVREHRARVRGASGDMRPEGGAAAPEVTRGVRAQGSGVMDGSVEIHAGCVGVSIAARVHPGVRSAVGVHGARARRAGVFTREESAPAAACEGPRSEGDAHEDAPSAVALLGYDHARAIVTPARRYGGGANLTVFWTQRNPISRPVVGLAALARGGGRLVAPCAAITAASCRAHCSSMQRTEERLRAVQRSRIPPSSRGGIGLTKHVSPKAMRRTFQDLARAAEVKDIVTRAISGRDGERAAPLLDGRGGGNRPPSPRSSSWRGPQDPRPGDVTPTCCAWHRKQRSRPALAPAALIFRLFSCRRERFRTSDPYRVKETPSVTQGDQPSLFSRFSIRRRTGASSPIRLRCRHLQSGMRRGTGATSFRAG